MAPDAPQILDLEYRLLRILSNSPNHNMSLQIKSFQNGSEGHTQLTLIFSEQTTTKSSIQREIKGERMAHLFVKKHLSVYQCVWIFQPLIFHIFCNHIFYDILTPTSVIFLTVLPFPRTRTVRSFPAHLLHSLYYFPPVHLFLSGSYLCK